VAVVGRQAQLPEVVVAADAVGGFPHPLYGSKEQPDEDSDNCYHDQELDQGEAAPPLERFEPG
jgi:hypothetical protein